MDRVQCAEHGRAECRRAIEQQIVELYDVVQGGDGSTGAHDGIEAGGQYSARDFGTHQTTTDQQ